MSAARVHLLNLLLVFLPMPGIKTYGQKPESAPRRVTVTTVQKKAVTITQEYVCKIGALRHIEVRTPVEGYIAAISVKEGQAVKRGDVLAQVRRLASNGKAGADPEPRPFPIEAPFDGLVGALPRQRDSLVLKGEVLTTLYDDSLMQADFHVPEARYLEYFAPNASQSKEEPRIELILANGSAYEHPGKLGTIAAEFKAGQVRFRANFPNPERVLRHGQTGSLSISLVRTDAAVVPQRAIFELLDKRYVFVVGADNVVRQREVVLQNEADDLFVIKSGVRVGDKIVLEGGRTLHHGEKVQY